MCLFIFPWSDQNNLDFALMDLLPQLGRYTDWNFFHRGCLRSVVLRLFTARDSLVKLFSGSRMSGIVAANHLVERNRDNGRLRRCLLDFEWVASRIGVAPRVGSVADKE